MKTTAKILITVAAAALLGAMAMDAQAGSCVSFGFGYGSGYRQHWGVGYSAMYYPPPVYYYAPRPVYYAPPPPPPPVVYTAPRTQSQPFGVADVKALAKAEVSDEVIISQIRNTRAVFRLTTAEIIDLKDSGVSQRVIDMMINTNGS